ncbi:dTDP-4-dehydrorhamnose 3,5-epimerase family protein [Streptomyces griseoviridis]
MRGLHFTWTPPKQNKHVYCADGRALDDMLDTRVGSPTRPAEFGGGAFRAAYFPPSSEWRGGRPGGWEMIYVSAGNDLRGCLYGP